MLSANFIQIKRLRSIGDYAAALALLSSSAIKSDDDAFEAIICAFTAGDFETVVNRAVTHHWQQKWSLNASQALKGIILREDPRAALALARAAIGDPGANWDAIAIFLILLQMNGLMDEAEAYVRANLQSPPVGEILLLTVLGEIAVATDDWTGAYTRALSVLSANPNNFRALEISSVANYEIGNVYESLGNALRANRINRLSQPAVLQLMRCYNKIGDYYAAISSFDQISGEAAISPDIHAQLGIAYMRLANMNRAIDSYRIALSASRKPIAAMRGLLELYIDSGATREREKLLQQYHEEINKDVESVNFLALYYLQCRDLDTSHQLFRQCLALVIGQQGIEYPLGWPVREPRIRHDFEQLELLQHRGKLAGSAVHALPLLKHYYDQSGDIRRDFAPTGSEAGSLRKVLTDFHHCPDPGFSGKALGENDYAAIEEAYFTSSPALVVIDNFLSPSALSNLRGFCEEATIWKTYYDNGYVGATMSGGFSPRVLLAAADELKQAMPRVIAGHPLTQAWAFKYDQRMQGINLHADFARINVNFWIAPEDSCEDKETGGMVIYDLPAPATWTFDDYNGNSGKMAAFVRENNAKPRRIPHRENRCVLFDSRLFHTTDELHFKPGYTNRRVNVTLLYGKSTNAIG